MQGSGSPIIRRTAAASGYLVAILAVSVTSLLREKLRPLLTDHAIFAMDYLAIAFAARYGGFGPGMAAAITAVPFAMLILPPEGFAVAGTANWIALILFVVISVAIVALIESARRARQRALDAAAALAESREKYRGLFERNLAGVSRTTTEGTIVECNRALARIYGFPDPASLMAVRADTLHESAAARTAFVERLREAGGALVNVEAVGRRHDGSTVWTLESHQLVEEDGCEIIEGSILDISERQRADQEREHLLEELGTERARLEKIIREMPAGVVIADASGHLVLGNDQFERILRTKFDESRRIGTAADYRGFTPDGSPLAPEDWPLAQTLATGTDVRNREIVIERSDGSRAIVVASASALRSAAGGVAAAVGTFFEITEQRALADELALRLRELGEADRRKDEFLAMLAHELRNPLVPIANAVRVLRSTADADPVARQSRQMIERQLAHMVRLIDDLLEVSRISRGKLEMRFETFDLASAVREVVADFRAEIGRHGLVLHARLPDRPLSVGGDPVRLAEVVTNLLRNAVKFKPPGGSITVTLEPDGEGARLTVADSGIGIETAMLPHVFEAFSQADRSIARTRGGLGLGLALVRGIVSAHGGTVEAASEGPGRGASFAVRLPRMVIPEIPVPAAPAAPPRASAATTRSVIVVEDNDVVAEGMRFLLRHLGHDVRIAPDGKSALRMIRSRRPDVVLCDIGLPGAINGYDVAEALRRDPELSDISLVALTGYGQEEDRRRAEQAGFDLHLTKPVQPTRLEEVLAAPPRVPAGR